MKKIKSYFFFWQVTLTDFIFKLFDIPAPLLSHCCQASPTNIESLSKNHEVDFCNLLTGKNLALHILSSKYLMKTNEMINVSQKKDQGMR